MSFDHVVELMDAQQDDLKVAYEGVRALNSSLKIDALIAAGGHIQLLKAITTHPSDAKLCEFTCWALKNIADGPDGPRSAALIDAGAGPVLASVALTHSGQAKEYAEEALNNIGLRRDGTQKVHFRFFPLYLSPTT